MSAANRPDLLILAYYFPPENSSGAARPFRFYKYGNRLGRKVHVISGGAPGITGEDCSAARVPDSASRHPFDLAMQVVQRLTDQRRDRLTWMRRAVDAAVQVVRTTSTGYVMSTSPPIVTHLAAMQLKRRLGLRWIADFRDPLVGNAFRQKWLTRWYDQTIERTIFESADLLIANTDQAADLWRNRYPQHAGKVVTLWNGFDPEEIIEPKAAPARTWRELLHVGDVYGPRHPGMLLESLERLRAAGQASQWRLSLVGPLNEDDSPLPANPAFQRLSSAGVVEANRALVPKHEAHRRMGDADHLLLLDLTGRQRNIQVPAKIFDYIRAGKPVLTFTTRQSPAEWILSQSGIPYTCVYVDDTPADADRKIAAHLQLPSTTTPYNEWFRNNFDAEAQAVQLLTAMDRL